MTAFEQLPYRPCAGLTVLNRAGLVFIGRRNGGPEHSDATHVWQMPQGGIDAGEDPWPAAVRELREETNITSVDRLGEIAEWLTYDIPHEIVGFAWNGKYRGQKQKWFALRFTGDEREINILHPAGGHEPEFVEWRWEKLRQSSELGRAIQAQGLRAGGQRIQEIRLSVSASLRPARLTHPVAL